MNRNAKSLVWQNRAVKTEANGRNHVDLGEKIRDHGKISVLPRNEFIQN